MTDLPDIVDRYHVNLPESVKKATVRFVRKLEKRGVYPQVIVTAEFVQDNRIAISYWFKDPSKDISKAVVDAVSKMMESK